MAEAFLLGICLCAGLIISGYLISSSALKIKGLDRTVTVKGLSERDVPADIAIWPIRFGEAENDLGHLYALVEKHTHAIVEFLKKSGFDEKEISVAPPATFDRQAQTYTDSAKIKFRFTSSSLITVYTAKIDLIMKTMQKLVELGKEGIAIGGQDYESKTEFLFTKLNDIKPAMIEEATRNAREVAEKFAKDSNSKLGKIKTAQQGQFTITDRDSSTPHIKKVRVVSTVEYYLSD
jgi:hypothetical protein